MDAPRFSRPAGNQMKIKLYIIVTVDTESSDSPWAIKRTDLLSSMVYGQIHNTYWGFPKIMEICDRFGFKATFFVSVFEYKKYGEDSLSQVCVDVKQKGHDIQLHTHPIWLYGRRYMHDYPFPDQVKIIGLGKELLQKWVSESPVAHRAGVYGVNENTLKALKENSIPIDSSNFYGDKQCQLMITKNKVVEKDEIIEVPVTVLKRNTCINLGLTRFGIRERYIKTDINWLSLDELLHFLAQAKRHNLRVMTLFLHSYSLLQFDASFTRFQPDYQTTAKLEEFLSIIAKDLEVKVITAKEFLDLYYHERGVFTDSSDFVPETRREITLAEVFRRGFGRLRISKTKPGVEK